MRGSREISLVPSLHRASTDALMTLKLSFMISTGLLIACIITVWCDSAYLKDRMMHGVLCSYSLELISNNNSKSFILQFIGTYAEITKSPAVPPAEASRASEDKWPQGTYADIELLPTNSTLPPPVVGERVQYSRARRERQPHRARQLPVPGQVTNDSRLQGQEQNNIPEVGPADDVHPHPLG